MYEQYERWCKLKSELVVEKEINSKKFEKIYDEIQNEKESLRQITIEKDLSHQNFIKETELKSNEQIHEIKEQYGEIISSLENKHEIIIRSMMENYSIKSKNTCLELEEVKNLHTHELMQMHERNLEEIRAYFKEITNNNLNLINTLNERIENMKSKEERLEKQISELSQKNDELIVPLNDARLKLAENDKKFANWTHLKKSLDLECRKSKEANEKVRDLSLQLEINRQSLERIEKEKNQHSEHNRRLIKEMRVEAEAENIRLIEENRRLKEQLEMSQIKASNRLDNQELIKKCETIIKEKNNKISILTREISKITNAYEDCLRMHRNHLKSSGNSDRINTLI
ncbi:MAG: Dynein regulatory complex subunit 4 [Marteilia pararefringens]